MFKFECGDKVKDVVTGLQGVIMARIEYLTGCNQYAVTAQKLTKEGKRPDWEYIDENRLEKAGGKLKLPSEKRPDRGADGNLPDRI